MGSQHENGARLEPDSHGIPPSAVCWWRGRYPPFSSTLLGGNTSSSSSQECQNGDSESNDGQSLSNSEPNEEDNDAIKDSQTNIASRSGGNYEQEHQCLQRTASPLPPGSYSQPPQLDLVGHSIACASNLYQDPCYGGMMAYGGQPMVHSQLLGAQHARMLLSVDMEQEPVYVNAKQYHGILRRRQSRAKAEIDKKLIKVRKPYLHESRHQHALRRERGSGGRFAKKTAGGGASNGGGKVVDGGGVGGCNGFVTQSHSAGSSGSELLLPPSARAWSSSNQASQRPLAIQ